MAGIAAGVVTAGDVNSQPSQGGSGMQPAHWSYIWFGLATLYLVGVYTGMLRIARSV
jgi:hypothetical protein